MPTRRLTRAFVLFFAALAFAPSALAQALPTPEQYLGFRVGTDKKLATWPQVVAYMQMAARSSDRVRYEELAKSTMGHPFPLVAISSPANLARLDDIRSAQRQLAYPYSLSPQDAESLIAKNPAVILITLTIHASEIGSTQMSLELVHRLATEQSPYIENLLNNVVLLLAPSVNPDGQV
ncbi:MAG TPA: M14 family zinc carboxypeptidase, partial [Candidatus Acidoferrales bacterium]|nr:M14 family zinc carboxypeptidase [Candidatus Acidoferrales bacterium]